MPPTFDQKDQSILDERIKAWNGRVRAKAILTAIGLIFVFYALVMQTEKLP